MRVGVDVVRCEGHGRCEAVFPDFFTLDDDGYSSIGDDKPAPPNLIEDVRLGVESCPVQALRATSDT